MKRVTLLHVRHLLILFSKNIQQNFLMHAHKYRLPKASCCYYLSEHVV